MRILLIEDDPMIGSAAQAALKDASYAADWAKNGTIGLNAFATQAYDLVLLDLGLPGQDGFEVLQAIRAQNQQIPVIIATARDSVEDRIGGLDSGADDYIVKPFDMGELLARMRAVLRRKNGSGTPVLDNGVITLDPTCLTACRAGSEPVQLSKREFAVLQALMQRPGAIRSRTDLEEHVYGWSEEIESNAIEFLIHALRKKLGKDAIKNIRGAGWMVARPQ